MTNLQRYALVSLRVAIGMLFLYAGITKVADPAWSAKGYLLGAQTFHGFYAWLASGSMLTIVNFLNAWGLTLLGIALMLGIMTRLSGFLGALMMLLYYFPVLKFPIIPPHAYLVDEHIIYIAALLVLAGFSRDIPAGAAGWFKHLPCCGGAKKEKGDAPEP